MILSAIGLADCRSPADSTLSAKTRASGGPPEIAAPFDIRNLRPETDDGTITRTHRLRATIVQVGGDGQQSVAVVAKIKHLSGGNPDAPPASVRYQTVIVTGGAGELTEHAGFYFKNALDQAFKTELEQVELTVAEYLPFATLPTPPVPTAPTPSSASAPHA